MLRDRRGTETSSPSLYSPDRSAASSAQSSTRASNGLDQFFSSIQDQSNLSILDFAGASQANVSFITTLGHRIFSNDILHTLDEAFGGDGDFVANQSDPRKADFFLRESLDFSERSFDGALVWDTLQFLAPPLLQETVDRLFHVLRPQSALLAFFHAEEKANTVPLYNYRIVESKTLSLTPRGQRKPAQYFNNRSLEKLFQKYHSVKFFLTRDHLREVIVRR
ncbi:MAG TPA: class I SAM-dependent methyltransferase [Bryobacteraceae bacterium]|nr:class I SAM-dependent methyltransferase [Bryobacteraceae bacterium]